MTITRVSHDERASARAEVHRDDGGRAWPGVGPTLVVVGSVAVVVALLRSGQTPRAAPPGLPDAGAAMTWTVLVSRSVMRLAAVGTVGCLLTSAWLLPATAGAASAVSPAARRLARGCAVWAVAWLLGTLLLMLSSSAQLLGVAYREALVSGAVWAYVPQLAEGRGLMLTLPPVMLVAMHASSARQQHSLRWLLVPAVLALLPMALTGHAATSADHYLATQSLLLHVLAVTFWVGGLLGLVQLRGLATDTLERAVRRFSALALCCFVVVLLSGILSAGTRLGTDPQAWNSAYGALVLVKLGTLSVLGLAGWWHRQRTIPAIGAGRRGAFRRVAVAELLVMSATTGVAVVLSRTAPPVRPGFVASSHASWTVEPGLPEVGLVPLLALWRPEALVVTLVAALAAAYVATRWGSLRSGRARAVPSAAWFAVALVVLLWAFTGGPAVYQNALLSGHVGQLLLCLVVLPRLLVRGLQHVQVREPVEQPWRRFSAVLRVTSDPVNSALLVALFLVAVYATPLLDLSLRSAVVHQCVSTGALVVGCACLRWRRSPGPAGASGSGRVVAVTLALFGAAILSSQHLLAGDWFSSLPLEWTDPVADQRFAGALMVLTAAVLALLERPRRLRGQRAEADPADSRASIACR